MYLVLTFLLAATLNIGFHMISLWMHEVVLHNKTATDQLQPPYHSNTFKDSVVGLDHLSAAQASAISACVSAADAIFSIFLSLDVDTTRCLPTYNCVRVAYSLVIILKLYFSASSPGSELGRIVGRGELRIEYYLDAMLEKFRLMAADDGSRIGSKFIVVLAMLKGWLVKQLKQDEAAANSSPKDPYGQQLPPSSLNNTSTPRQNTSQHHQQQQQQHRNANTPLQLLSEVAAAGSDSTHPRASTAFTNLRQIPQPFFYDNTPPASSTTTTANYQPPVPSSSSDTQQQQQQANPPWIFPDTTSSAPPPPAMANTPGDQPYDFGGMAYGTGLDLQTPYEVGDVMGLDNVWFGDMIMGLHEPTNIFPF